MNVRPGIVKVPVRGVALPWLGATEKTIWPLPVTSRTVAFAIQKRTTLLSSPAPDALDAEFIRVQHHVNRENPLTISFKGQY